MELDQFIKKVITEAAEATEDPFTIEFDLSITPNYHYKDRIEVIHSGMGEMSHASRVKFTVEVNKKKS